MFWKLLLDQGEGELFISFFMLRVFNFREKKNGTSTHGVYKVYDSMEDELQSHPQETTLVLHNNACSGDYTGDLLKYCLACVLRCPMPARLLYPWIVLGKNTGASCHFLLQGTFPTQSSNPRLLPGQADALPEAPPGKP